MKKILYVIVTTLLCLLASLWYGCKEKENIKLTGDIYGTVSIAGTFEPMSGTGVALHYMSPKEDIGALLLRTTTAEDGSYEFHDIRAGVYILRVEVPGYKVTQYDVVVESGRPARADMQVTPNEKSIPQVKTLPVTNERLNGSATLNALIIELGNPVYSERGFVYGSMHNPILEYADVIKIVVSGDGVNEYSATIKELDLGIYYVRAYAINDEGISYGTEETIDLTIDIPFVYVEGGSFDMGCMSVFSNECGQDELPVHRVTLDGFHIGAYEITQKQWEKVMGTTIENQGNIYCPGEPHNGLGADYPMYCINWNEAQTFCQELGRITGKKYRLPTEAEWEYAARGGKKMIELQYSGSNELEHVAWYYANSNNKVHPVGGKLPNVLGIFDMTGNVAEWCQDWAAEYTKESVRNPQGPTTGSMHIVRGGSFAQEDWFCRVTMRMGLPHPAMPGRERFGDVGFRIVREI